MQSVPKIVRDRLQAVQPAGNHPDADLLTAFAEQSLPEVERATVLDHLARCADCRDVVALALPPFETLKAVKNPSRGGWMTWPALRWGFVAAGVVIIASVGFLQYQHHAATSMMSYRVPESAALESRAQSIAPMPAPGVQPTEKRDEAKATLSSDSVGAAKSLVVEPKQTAPTATPPAAAMGKVFHGGAAGAPGGNVSFGPKGLTQFQYNNSQLSNNSQVSNNMVLPAANQPAARNPSAPEAPRATNEAVEVSGAAPAISTESASLGTGARDQLADSVSKSKLPVPTNASGQIGGYVVDPTGAVVSNARITITPTQTGGSTTAMTNAQGAWQIAGLSTGNYKAQAEAPGFKTTVADLEYDANRPSAYSFTLSPGSVSETVEVSSAAPVVQTQGYVSSAGGAIDKGETGQLPLTGRNSVASLSTPPPRWTISSAGSLQRSFDQGKSWQTVDVIAGTASMASMEIVTTSRAKLSKEKDVDKKALKQPAAASTFRTVTAAGAEVWAGGSASVLYHSVDAGNHWTRVLPSSAGSVLTGDIVSLEFPDPQHGKITTSTPEVWTTSDAGQTWQKQ